MRGGVAEKKEDVQADWRRPAPAPLTKDVRPATSNEGRPR